MSRAAVAMASSALRRLVAASRPMVVARAIYTAPVTVGRPFPLFRPSPMFLFPRKLSRGYARGRGARLSDDDDELLDDEDSDDEDLDDGEGFDDKDLNWGSEEDMGDEFTETESE